MMSTFTTFIWHYNESSSQYIKTRKKKSKKDTRIRKEEVKLSLFADGTLFLHRKFKGINKY